MDNDTSTTYYDVLIEDDFTEDLRPQCHKHDDKAFEAQVLPVFYTVIFLLGLGANGFLALILIKYKQLRELVDVFFLNMTIANFLFLFTFPFWIYTAKHSWDLGDPICRLISGVYSVGFYGYTCFLVLSIIHRYMAVVHVGRFHIATRKTAYSIIAGMWGLALLASLPEFILFQVQMEGSNYICHFVQPHYLPGEEKSWSHFLALKMNILGFLIPVSIAIFCFWRIKKTSRYKEKKYEILRFIFVKSLVFMGLWTPYNLVLFLRTFREQLNLNDCENSYQLDRAAQITKIIANTYCCINPVVYELLHFTFYKCLYCPFHPQNNAEGHLRERPI
ncbi:chemokine C-C motif receptor-like 2 [Macrotis lagotis]|uniref:chemokine C-C motif receptor-like 2 n=1 Tax=Macrotis lagotis TaxID=92651 RepID=UPI003D69D6CC